MACQQCGRQTHAAICPACEKGLSLPSLVAKKALERLEREGLLLLVECEECGYGDVYTAGKPPATCPLCDSKLREDDNIQGKGS